eukprot:TRINITY_DN3788_c0_g1_i14.p2 TRINITY_DN3788_c0_g1~~TRINITY_DN3788_c0_g1_i14.p2  ORF type:complete len:114 (+),score=55.17 TRINITY_DN3788_c0_g1_i14:271-612(+)
MGKTATPSKKPNSSTISKAIKKPRRLRPKRPLTGYFWYLKERRSGLARERPEMKNKDMIRKMAEEWKALNKEKQKAFLQKAEEDKKRYEQELKIMGGKCKKRKDSSDSVDSTK